MMVHREPDGVVVFVEREIKALPIVGCPSDRLPLLRPWCFLYFHPSGPIGWSAETNSVVSVWVP